MAIPSQKPRPPPPAHPTPAPAAPSGRESALPTLLADLPEHEHARLVLSLERVRLELRQVLHQPGERIDHVYFPIDALVSLLTVLEDGGAIETGLVGREGMAGLAVFLRSPVADRRAVCQQAGDAWRLPTAAFLAALDEGGTLAARLLPYTHEVLRVAAQTAACNRAHPVEERCARWLLMVDERVGTGAAGAAGTAGVSAAAGGAAGVSFAMTQQFMAEMLGVRRASVVVVLGTLARAGLIQNHYGTVTILDRSGLEGAACECYRMLRLDRSSASSPRAAHDN